MSTYDDEPTRRLPRPAPTDAGSADATRPMRLPTTDAQQTRRSAPPTAPLPGPLRLHEPSDSDVSLDELFEAAPDAAIAAEAGPAPISAEAPTWTAMPVVPVRSDTTPVAARPQRNPLISAQLRSDALAAWHGTRRRTQDWLRQQDNALIALTAIVAILLIVVVAALGH